MNFKEIFNKTVGKERNDRTYAITMLIVFGIIITGLVIAVRTSPKQTKPSDNNNQGTIKEDKPTNKEDNKQETTKEKNTESDVSYSYSYNIKFDDQTETYIGKKYNDKEKFSYVKNDETKEYAIYNDNYLILKDGIYHITDSLNTYFKYCDVEKLFDAVDEKDSLEEDKYIYDIPNKDLASLFNEKLTDFDTKQNNRIEFIIEEDNLKGVKLNLSNYISNILKADHNLEINMEFANIGTTEDFEIKMN